MARSAHPFRSVPPGRGCGLPLLRLRSSHAVSRAAAGRLRCTSSAPPVAHVRPTGRCTTLASGLLTQGQGRSEPSSMYSRTYGQTEPMDRSTGVNCCGSRSRSISLLLGSRSSEVVASTSEARRRCSTVQSASNRNAQKGALRWFGPEA